MSESGPRPLAHYRITAAIGAGGMGEVYRATDTKLNRDVAIKMLPTEVAGDPERLARFKREAQLLASLNHPNIAAIHGLEEADGKPFLVLELVEGEDLAQRLKRGAIPVDEALAIGRQIAEGLEAAHEKGIAHRDLKPANIKLTHDGKVKVLDFGLAKASEGDTTSASSADLSHSPTLAHSGTQAGLILGTAAYMSPEQARGRKVDKRADIWSFGVVLYEMLTGKQLFAGETVSDTLAAVLRQEVDWAALPAGTPPALRQTLRQCLERDPHRRLHDIADARIIVEDLVTRPEALEDARTDAPPLRTAIWKTAVPWGIALVATATSVWTSRVVREPALPNAAAAAFTVEWRQSASAKSLLRGVVASRDGRRLLLWDSFAPALLVRDLDSFETRALPGTSEVYSPFWSPDGQWVGFFSEGVLRKVALAGGDPVRICDVTADSPGATWGPDGEIYFTPSWTSGLWRVPEGGGAPEELTRPAPARGESVHFAPSLLPDGRTALLTILGPSGIADARIARFDLTSRKLEPLMAGALARYVASGHVVFFRHGTWMAVRCDPGSRSVIGSEAHILPGARPLLPTGGRESSVSFSDAGPLAYVASESSFYSPYTRLAWVDRDGHIEPLPFGGHHYYNSLDLSPDGRKAAVALMSEGQLQVWVYDLERGTREQLTRDGLNLEPNWSPDGTSIAVTGQFRGNYDVRIWKAGGQATPTVELGGPLDESNWKFVPGTALGVYIRGSVETGNDLWSREAGVEGSDRVLFASPFDEFDPQPSRDGQFVAYTSQSKLYVMRADGAGERSQVAIGASFSEWSPTARELYILKGGKIVAVPYDVVGGTFRPRTPHELVEPPRPPIEMAFAASPDGRRFLVFVPVPGKTRDPEVRVLTDGFGLLRRALEVGGRER